MKHIDEVILQMKQMIIPQTINKYFAVQGLIGNGEQKSNEDDDESDSQNEQQPEKKCKYKSVYDWVVGINHLATKKAAQVT